MSISTSHKPPGSSQRRETHGGGGDFGGGDEGGGGGGGDGGRLVKVAFARTQPEGELIQGLLREADIPSVLWNAMPLPSGTYMPGPVDVMVAAETAKRARRVLAETFGESEDQERLELEEERRLARGETGITPPGRLAFWVAVAAVGAFLLVWLLYKIT